jgi:hypothetical protein
MLIKNSKLTMIIIVASSAATFFSASAADNDSSSNDEWHGQRAKYDLLDREKFLLSKDDDLGRHIYSVQQNIKTLLDDLKASQSEQDRVRHELIIVRVKLLH